jgi:colanic acid biosynthesis protein WcaH
MHLDDNAFLRVIEATPLVSIDLLIRNQRGQVLLGKRSNRPALGCWFVPGGRIRKNETVNAALRRISAGELGIVIEEAKLVGAFDHIYPDNFAGEPGINTHYVVLAFETHLQAGEQVRPDAQHSDLRWWDVEEARSSMDVHENTKAYFHKTTRN